MQSARARLLILAGTVAGGAMALTYAAYRRDLRAARQKVATDRQIIDSPHGPIEFAESGDGPAVLVIHGAGGGFDQGLELGRSFVGDGYRIVAPSRFGYLGTPVPADASAEAQADAHRHLLDVLQLETVPVIGVSAGAPSAMQLCIRHPERCSALVLIVPLAWAPDHVRPNAPSPMFARVLDAIADSDFIYWAATKVARPMLLATILGTPVEDYRKAAKKERKGVEGMLRDGLPMSRRFAGIQNDGVIASGLTRYRLEDIRVPTLVISAADDLYGTYDSGMYTAEEIHDGRFIGFPTGGHLLVGHDREARAQVTTFLNAPQRGGKRMSMVG